MKSLFHCKQADVRPISGTIANDAVFSRYIKPGDIVMVNSTPGGGHISHHKAGSVGKYTRNIINFPLTPDGWHIDVDHTLDLMKALEPKVMIMGKSLFLFPEPVKEIAPYCKQKGIHLIYDAAHVLGLIAGHQFQDPLGEGVPLITGSTHKTFFGSQRGVILSNVDDEEWRKIDKGDFPAPPPITTWRPSWLSCSPPTRSWSSAWTTPGRSLPMQSILHGSSTTWASRSRQSSSGSRRATRWPSTWRISAAGMRQPGT